MSLLRTFGGRLTQCRRTGIAAATRARLFSMTSHVRGLEEFFERAKALPGDEEQLKKDITLIEDPGEYHQDMDVLAIDQEDLMQRHDNPWRKRVYAHPSRWSVPPPDRTEIHGRGWLKEELRRKSFDDLHKLWYVCLKERNMLHTQNLEVIRWGLIYDVINVDRLEAIRQTMHNIKEVLVERHYAFEDAHAELNPKPTPATVKDVKSETGVIDVEKYLEHTRKNYEVRYKVHPPSILLF